MAMQVKPKIDKEISALLPELTDEEFDKLVENIKADGQREPGIVWTSKDGDVLLDGHNRLKATEKLKVPFKAIKKKFPDRDAAIQWVFDNQFGRRNMTKEKRDEVIRMRVAYLAEAKIRAAAEAKVENGVHKERGQNDHAPARGPGSVNIYKEVAEEAGVSAKTVQRAVEDAKTFCKRCIRVGPVKDCPYCAKMQEKRPKKKRKSGTVLVDWKKFEAAMGVVIRFEDDIRRHYKTKVSPGELNKYGATTKTLYDFFKKWKKELP